MTTLRSHYLNALGIAEYLHAPRNIVDLPNVKVVQIQCLVVEFKNPGSICKAGAQQDFLYKMLSAIGVNKKEVICIEVDADNFSQEISKYKSKAILLMGSGFKSIATNSFVMHHPNDILKNEQLKRDTWEVLKQVKICLN